MNNNINTLLNSLSNLVRIRKADKKIEELNSKSDNTMAVGTRRKMYKYFPTKKEELQQLILERLWDSENNKANYECDLNDIYTGYIKDMSYLFSFTEEIWQNSAAHSIYIEDFNGHIEEWDVSNVEDMTAMFFTCEEFNQDLSGWDVHNVEEYQHCFEGCDKMPDEYKPKFLF